MLNEINKLIEISKYAGERFDLIQAGGGNSSVKLDNGEMIIKSSGFLLSEMNLKTGFTSVRNNKILEILDNSIIINEKIKKVRETLSAELVKNATISFNKPSIETLLHSLLLTYVLHTHPVVVNMISNKNNWKELFNKIFKDDNIILIDYETPGIDLAILLKTQVDKHQITPKIIFLQNHGLIINSDDHKEIYSLNEYVLSKIEKFLNVDFSKYKISNKISKLFNKFGSGFLHTTFFSEDYFLNDQLKKNKDYFFYPPFCPDSFVFCGAKAIEINDLKDDSEIENYFKNYGSLPSIIIFTNHIFISAYNIKKCREKEEVLKFNIKIISNDPDNINYLSKNELEYLGNWEAEKFRQNI
jgi:ribulose-5-phosphate 4-epimerase/fuculose-1-phosphate aldolase